MTETQVHDQEMKDSYELSVQASKDADSIAVNSEESLGFAGDFLRTIKALHKKIKKVFDPSRKSTYAAYKDVLKLEKSQLQPLEQAEKVIKDKMGTYQDESEARRLKLEAKNQKKAEKTGLPYVPPPAPAKLEGIQTRLIWKYELVDISKVPREYLMLNQIKVQGAITSMKGATNIPGVRVYEEKVIAAQAADIY